MALVLTRLVRSNYDELDNIPIIHQDLTASFTKQTNTYYIHTGSTTSAYTKGRMYYCDGTNLKKVVIVDELPAAPNNGKLTITVNGTAHTFTANQAGDTSFSITNTDTGATDVEVTGSGNAVTAASYNASTRKLTLTKGTTFLTTHQDIKILNTSNTTAQTANSNEAIIGSGMINLHQVAKTGIADKVVNGLTLGNGVVYDGSKAMSINSGDHVYIAGGPNGIHIGLEYSVMPSTYNKVTVDGHGIVTAGENVNYLTSHQNIKSINTNNTTAQTANASEVIVGSGTINLHKVAKTGNYNDLLNKPTIPDISGKLDKTTYEWNKEFRASSNGAISLGRYNIYDTQLTFDISSTTTASMSGKLVIATQNGKILQAKVFGDAAGALVSKIVIYQSAIIDDRSWVEVFCNFDGWSKNKVHIYGVGLNSATVTNQMSSVTFTNEVPSPVTSGDSKWSGTIDNDLSGKQNKLTAGSNITISGNTISAMDTGATSVGVDGSGNAVTSASYNASTRKLTLTKGTTFVTTNTAQTISSIKTFTVGFRIKNWNITEDSSGNLVFA